MDDFKQVNKGILDMLEDLDSQLGEIIKQCSESEETFKEIPFSKQNTPCKNEKNKGRSKN